MFLIPPMISRGLVYTRFRRNVFWFTKSIGSRWAELQDITVGDYISFWNYKKKLIAISLNLFLAGAWWNWCGCCLAGRIQLLLTLHSIICHDAFAQANFSVVFELFGSYQQLLKGESKQRTLKLLAGISHLTFSPLIITVFFPRRGALVQRLELLPCNRKVTGSSCEISILQMQGKAAYYRST